ncbi:MAG TPA: flavin reductase family protein [Thermomicrobiales bacterium]|nr:flavin reductase family protein [Thermomicrobiales bacterium]
MDAAAKKAVLRLFPYGLYAVTVAHGDERNGFTANWLAQASFEPPMVMVAVENDGKSIGLLRAAGVFTVNVYATGQRELAGHLGRSFARNPRKIDEVGTRTGANGCPILDDALGYLECRVTDEVPAGDHTVFVGEITEAGLLREGEALTMRETGFKYSG